MIKAAYKMHTKNLEQMSLALFRPRQTKPGKCYLIACTRAILNDKNKKDIFQSAISRTSGNSHCVFYKGIKKSFEVFEEELKSRINLESLEKNSMTRIFEAATRKMLLSEHFWKKFQKEPLKFYSATLFFKKFIGEKPVSVGEFSPFTLDNPLNFLKKKRAVKILEKISDAGEGNFTAVAGTQLKRQPPPEKRKYDIRKNHYYVIKKVDKENKIISVENPRLNEAHPNLTY
ncbi:MAG: hypothetical protein WCF95_04045 [bacterium]